MNGGKQERAAVTVNVLRLKVKLSCNLNLSLQSKLPTWFILYMLFFRDRV